MRYFRVEDDRDGFCAGEVLAVCQAAVPREGDWVVCGSGLQRYVDGMAVDGVVVERVRRRYQW